MMDKEQKEALKEYVWTYSWAILVVIIVGFVLWQGGYFKPVEQPVGCPIVSHSFKEDCSSQNGTVFLKPACNTSKPV